MAKTTEAENNQVRLEHLERFILRMRLYLDNGYKIQPGSEAHGELITMTNFMLTKKEW